MLRGGVGVQEGDGGGESGEEGSPFEQVALALDVVKFNVGECAFFLSHLSFSV